MIRRFSLLAAALGVALVAVFAATVPRPSPELKIEQVGGPTLLLSQYRGKVVALAFVITTCPHCQHFSELLDKMYKIYGPRGFRPIDAAFNDGAVTLVNAFKADHNLTFPVGVVSRDDVYKYLERPAAQPNFFVPQVVFLDRRGVIRAQYAGDSDFFKPDRSDPDRLEKNLRAEIEKLLGPPAGSHVHTAAP